MQSKALLSLENEKPIAVNSYPLCLW